MKQLKCSVMAAVILLLTTFMASCGNTLNDGIQLFSNEDIDKYAYGVIYSYHNVDTVVQLYSSDGTLIRTANIENVRACGMCSSPGKPYIKHDGYYYFVSDAAFDTNLKNSVIKLDPKNVRYERIELSMKSGFTYDFSIDTHDNMISSYYSGQPEWGCVYETSIKNDENRYYAFNELENFENVVPADAHFWPLDAIHLEDSDYFIGYITSPISGTRTLCIINVKGEYFDILCSLNGFLYADGNVCIDNFIYFSVFDNKDNAKILRYNIQEKKVDASLSLDYQSRDVDIYESDKQLVILNCDLNYSDQQRKAVYTSKELHIENTFDIGRPLRIFDFSSNKIVCSDTENIYVYDLEWNELTTFAIVKEPNMKFSGIFTK